MHLRWAQPSSIGYRPSTAIVRRVALKWDSRKYDYLGDTYSCVVNPIFWKLNGWVNSRIDDWKQANGITTEYQWKGTWVGVPPAQSPYESGTHPLPQDEALAELETIDQITSISRVSEFDGFFR